MVGLKIILAPKVPALAKCSGSCIIREVRFGATPESTPFVGVATMLKVSGSPSGSEPVRVMVTAVSSAVMTDWRLATGGVFLAEGVPHTCVVAWGWSVECEVDSVVKSIVHPLQAEVARDG